MAGDSEGLAFHRRSFLLGAVSLSAFGLPTLGARESMAAEPRGDVTEGPFVPNIPEMPDDPYLVSTHGTPPLLRTRGWESADRETVAESVLDLGLSSLNVHDLTGFSGPPLDAVLAYRHKAIGQFAHRWQLPHSSGFTRILEADTVNEGWYRDRPTSERWSYPDGSPVEHPLALASRRFDGDPHQWVQGTSLVIPSIFAPGTLDVEGQTGSQIYQLGVNELFVDGFEIGRLKGNDFSIWAREAFREHLESLDETRLAELGIADPATFDIRSYLREQGIEPWADIDSPAHDEVYREYTRHHHQRHKQYAIDLAERTKAGAPQAVSDAGASFIGNQAGIAGPQPTPIYLSDAVDRIDVEVEPTIPPSRPHDVTIKTGRAAGRFEKTVHLEGKLQRAPGVNTLHGLDPTGAYPTLLKFHLAQAYAHGGRRGISLSGWANIHETDVVNHWIRSNGTISDELQIFADFVRSNRRFLQSVDTLNTTVVMVSLPTLIWQRAPQWGMHVPVHTDAVRGTAGVLRREHIPYDVLIFDYPPVWAAPSQYERLQEYDLIILPGVECVSDDHVRGIEAALANATTVVATGEAPSRDEEYQSRGDVETLLEEAPAGTVIERNPERSSEGPGRGALREALPTDDRQVELRTGRDISVNLLSPRNSETLVFHLVNFEYDVETDSMDSQTELTATVRNLQFEPTVAEFHSLAGITDLEVSSEGNEVTLTIPELDVWGFVVFTSTSETASSTTAQTTAAARIEEAERAVGDADRQGRTEHLVKASAALENAQRSMEYGAYTVARRAADDAIEATHETYRTPRIGIDIGHHQSTDEIDSRLSTLRRTLPGYRYEDIDQWSVDSLDGVDVLIVPPVLAELTDDYGVTDDELDSVEGFVDGGGSLLLLGTQRVKPGFNVIAGRFGFELDGRPIVAEGSWSFDVDSPLSSLTAFSPRWGGKFGTAISSVETGTVLGRVGAYRQAWLSSDAPVDERGTDDPTAIGKPVLAGRAYGDGHVVVSGEARQFLEPRIHDESAPSPLVEQTLWSLGRWARYGQRSGAVDETPSVTPSEVGETETQTPEFRSPPGGSPEAPTTTSTPGFGIGTAIGGLAGFVSLLKWMSNDDEA